MKSNQEILDEFGKMVIQNIYDDGLRYLNEILSNTTKWGSEKQYTELFNHLNEAEKNLLKKYIGEILSTALFAFLKIFEENEQFKLFYEKDGQRVNLVEISEMLKAEPIIENGWIARFSKEVTKDS